MRVSPRQHSPPCRRAAIGILNFRASFPWPIVYITCLRDRTGTIYVFLFPAPPDVGAGGRVVAVLVVDAVKERDYSLRDLFRTKIDFKVVRKPRSASLSRCAGRGGRGRAACDYSFRSRNTRVPNTAKVLFRLLLGAYLILCIILITCVGSRNRY